jgi:site-specific DNA-methyltransferase (adenine-specific)
MRSSMAERESGERNYPWAFLIPKADRSDREPVLGGLPELPREARYGSVQDARPHTPDGYEYHRNARRNHHPTVKPVELMRHLVRLVTPPGGLILDPFLGSGTTAIAAEMEGFRWLGIEKEPEYVAIAEARLNGVQRGLGLVG